MQVVIIVIKIVHKVHIRAMIHILIIHINNTHTLLVYYYYGDGVGRQRRLTPASAT